MSTDGTNWNRLGLITDLSERMAQKPGEFGRTSLMKLIYFLQAVKGVPLGYNFTLYSYGPFDSSVLDDVSYATSLEAVKETVISYPNGYGYDIKPEEKASQIKAKAQDFLKEHKDSIEWVVEEFSKYSAADLELIGTIIYADQELLRKKMQSDLSDFISRVRKIKPHFTVEQIKRRTQQLLKNGLLHTITS
jgi:uncharacterized protein YwgA